MIENRWRDSAYGRVIHEDVALENMPTDIGVLIRSAEAYWDQVVQGAYSDDLMGSRVKSTMFCEKIWQLGKIDQYPRAAAQIAALKFAYEEYDIARACTEYWCEYIHLTADISTLNQELRFYLDEIGGDCEKVLDWCRRRAEQDRRRDDVPVGMILLRHYLQIQCFLDERREGEKTKVFWERMYRVYRLNRIWAHQLIEAKWQRTSLIRRFQHQNDKAAEKWEQNNNRIRANKGNLIALSHVLDKEWVWDTPEIIAGWQEKWDEGCAEIKQEEASFGSDWYENEKKQAAEFGQKQHKNGAIRREGRNLYMAGLARYALKDAEGAISLMREGSDKNSYEARGWLKRHGIDFLDRSIIKPYDEMYQMELLADRLYNESDVEGLKKLAEALEKGNDMVSPQPQVAAPLYEAAKPPMTEADVLDQVLAYGRADALKLADQMLEQATQRPELARKLHWYNLLVRMQVAKRDGTLLEREPLDFIAVDLSDSEEIQQLVKAAREEDWNALYKLCMYYAQEERLEVNPHLASVSYHLGRRVCELYREIYFQIEDPATRQGVLQDWIRISLLMDHGDNGVEPIRIGLYQEDPFCCSLLGQEEIVTALGLEDSQVIEYLQIAQDHGYTVIRALDRRIGSQWEVYTTDYFETRSRQRLEKREQARAWMADIDRLLEEGMGDPVLQEALRYKGDDKRKPVSRGYRMEED